MGKNKRKRNRAQFEEDAANGQDGPATGVGATMAHLRSESALEDGKAQAPDTEEWTTVGKGGKKQKTSNYPGLGYSELHRLQSSVNLNHLQGLVLYCIADGNMAPNWVSVRHHGLIQKAVVLFVPGLEKGMFNGSISLDADNTSSDLPIGSKDNHAEPTAQDATNGLHEKPEGANHAIDDRNMVNPFIDPSVSNGTHTTTPPIAAQAQIKAVLKPPPEVPHNHALRSFAQSPDDYLPIALVSDKLPEPLKELAGIFAHAWPIKAPGDDKFGKVHSPLHAMLNSPLTRTQEEKAQDKQCKGARPARAGTGWVNKRTPITEYITSREDLLENEFTLHPAWYTDADADADEIIPPAKTKMEKDQTEVDSWVNTDVKNLADGVAKDADIQQGSLTAGRSILALDCEMCLVQGGKYALTRISLVSWDGTPIMDELVKPSKPIIDYLTPYSGITPSKLANITTTLREIQSRLLSLITPQHILIGHSLNSDLQALKLTHPFIIDTSLLYPHPRGPPLKSSLKWLAQKYLSREIQKSHGNMGHDSVEDARACLDLVKVKCEKGPQWGTSEATTESIFKRLKRTPKAGQPNDGEHGKTGAIVDHGSPEKNFGNMASYCISCKTDEEVVTGVKRAVLGDEDGRYIPGGGVDFTWARFQELATMRGWLVDHRNPPNTSTTTTNTPTPSTSTPIPTSTDPSPTDPHALTTSLTSTIQNIKTIHTALPPCTLFIVCSGTGDPREMGRLQEMQGRFKREFKSKKWDELSVKWTDVEEQALKRAVKRARGGVGFVAVT